RGRRGKPCNARIFESRHKRWRVLSHDRRNGRGLELDEHFTLRAKVWKRRVACRRRYVRPPIRKERPHASFGSRISQRRRIGYPGIDLERAAALRSELLDPIADRLLRAHH